MRRAPPEDGAFGPFGVDLDHADSRAFRSDVIKGAHVDLDFAVWTRGCVGAHVSPQSAVCRLLDIFDKHGFSRPVCKGAFEYLRIGELHAEPAGLARQRLHGDMAPLRRAFSNARRK